MPDYAFNTNLSPAAPQSNMGDMLNLARGVQAYQQAGQANPLLIQQAQQGLQKGAMEIEQLKKTQPLAVRELTAKAETAESNSIGAVNALTFDNRVKVAQPFGTLAQSEEGGNIKYYEMLANKLKKDNPANKQLHSLVDDQVSELKGLNNPEDIKKHAALFSAILQPPETFAPTTTTTPEGKTVTQQRSPFGAPTTSTMGLAGQADPYTYTDTGKKDPISNLPIYDVRNKVSGKLEGQMVKAAPEAKPSGMTPAANIPAGESEATGTAYQAQIIAARDAVPSAKSALNNIDTVLKYLPLATTGSASEAIKNLESIFGTLSGSTTSEKAASARDIIEKNIADLGIQKNAALGGKFAASLDQASQSLASAGKNPTAIVSSMEQLRPLMQHVGNYSSGLNKAIEQSPLKQYVKPKFDSAMNDAFDPLALQMKNAADQGNFKKFVSSNKLDIVQQQKLFKKLEAYKALVNGDIDAYQRIISGGK